MILSAHIVSEHGKVLQKTANDIINIKLSHNRDILYTLYFYQGSIKLVDSTNGKVMYYKEYSTACPHGQVKETCATCKWNYSHR